MLPYSHLIVAERIEWERQFNKRAARGEFVRRNRQAKAKSPAADRLVSLRKLLQLVRAKLPAVGLAVR